MSLDIYKVLMYGDRHWDKVRPIRSEINRLIEEHGKSKLVIIEGEAPGADTLARKEAEMRSVHVCRVKALWETRGRGAGPQRNLIMASLRPDEAICFHSDIANSRGSRSMLEILDKELDMSSKLVTK